MNGPKQVEREVADGPGVREDGYTLAVVIAEDVSQLAGDASQQMPIAFAVGDDVVDVAVNEGVIVVGKLMF